MSTAAVAVRPTGVGGLLRHMDVALACGVIGVIIVMVVPLPTWCLDIFLCVQLALSLSILLGTIYSAEPLEFSGFPPLLLMVTLFRLGLNVATARLILLNGDAGSVITAFGQFVVGGNYVVGVTIFLILLVIQFVVITKGAGRVAEVAARFTLDAMPGKQMAIDADLNAGLINEEQARARRTKIEREANFYGAMDGASKFVRGDAVAALIITAINLLGGLAIACLQRGMSPADGLKHFALLTIGDGLVTQIPALLISTASGILVTRSASDLSLGEDFGRQLFMRHKALRVTAVFLTIFAFIPGLPTIPLLLMAAGAFALSTSVKRAEVSNAAAAAKKPAIAGKDSPAGAAPKNPDSPEAQLQMDILELELGPSLLPLVDKGGGDLLNRITTIRKKLAAELGIIIPPVRVRDNLQLPGRQYRVKVRGAVVTDNTLQPDRLLAIDPGGAKAGLDGLPARDPAFGLPALWITPPQRSRGEAYGYTVVEPVSVLSTHVHEVMRANAADLLSRQDVQKIVDRVKESDPGLVKDIVPTMITLATLHRVLQGLLRERVPIRDIGTILEVLGDFTGQNRPLEQQIEDIRVALSPSFVGAMLDENGKLISLALDPALESRLIQNLVQNERGAMLVLPPQQVTALVRRINDDVAALQKKKLKPVLVCSGALRSHIRRLVERSVATLPVISYSEVPRRATLEIVAQVPATIFNAAPESKPAVIKA